MKIIFLGTPELGAIILEGLIKNNYKPILVITAPVPSPVKIIAQKNGISIEQPQKIKNLNPPLAEKIKNLKPDLVIVAAYGQIIPQEILEIPKFGCLNVHPSLLPKYRGASPIQNTILNNDNETGVTIILMDEKMDHGPIISTSISRYVDISKMGTEELTKKLAELSVDLLIKTIPDWIEGKIKAIPQNDSKATYIKPIQKNDGKINWQDSAEKIERQIRAFNPWPGSFTDFNGKVLKIIEADVLEIKNAKQPGEVFLTNDGRLVVRTGQNCLILQKLQLEGKKPLNAREFLMGKPDIINSILN